MKKITFEDFKNVELRKGTIIDAEDFPEARTPAYILTVNFGKEIGIKKASAQITNLYSLDALRGKEVIAVVNFPPKQIGPMMSECLVTGFYREDGSVVLAIPDSDVEDGAKLG